MRNHGTPGTDYVPPVNEAVALPTPELATITLTNPQSFEKLLLDNTPFAVGLHRGRRGPAAGPAIATLSSVTVAKRAELLTICPWPAEQQFAVRSCPHPASN